jgi:hypothetical protein
VTLWSVDKPMAHVEEGSTNSLIGIEEYFHGDFCLYCRKLMAWYG